jgi:hypothetical protein
MSRACDGCCVVINVSDGTARPIPSKICFFVYVATLSQLRRLYRVEWEDYWQCEEGGRLFNIHV